MNVPPMERNTGTKAPGFMTGPRPRGHGGKRRIPDRRRHRDGDRGAIVREDRSESHRKWRPGADDVDGRHTGRGGAARRDVPMPEGAFPPAERVAEEFPVPAFCIRVSIEVG
jgi:hypothetical protein